LFAKELVIVKARNEPFSGGVAALLAEVFGEVS